MTGLTLAPLEDPNYVPKHQPWRGSVPEVVARWGWRSQLRWFARFRNQLRFQQPEYWDRFFIDSELHHGLCCGSCWSDIEDGYEEYDPQLCCCRAERRRTSA